MPCALHQRPLLLAKPLNSDLAHPRSRCAEENQVYDVEIVAGSEVDASGIISYLLT